MEPILTKQQILECPDVQKEVVHVPEWGGSVIVQGMTAGQRDAFEASVANLEADQKLANIRAKLVALSVVDEEGQPLFTMADVEELSQKSATAMDRIVGVAQQLSGLGAKAIEDAAGN